MKLQVVIIPFLFTILNSAQASPLNEKYCRKVKGVSRCVDEPLMVADKDLWCPYHVCAPTYVPAPECPAGPYQATHKCKTLSYETPLYRCLEGRAHKIIKLPLGCGTSDTPCTGETRACACEEYNPKRVFLTPLFSISPIC